MPPRLAPVGKQAPPTRAAPSLVRHCATRAGPSCSLPGQACPTARDGALFDADPKKIGKKVGETEVKDIKSFAEVVKQDNIEVAVIAVPAEFAQAALETVGKAGIKAVMNFAPVALKAPAGIKLKTIDLTTSLESLSYFLAQPAKQNSRGVKPKSKISRK